MQRTSNSLIHALTVLAFATGLTACNIPGLSKSEDATDPATSVVRKFSTTLSSESEAKSMAAFQKTVYPLVRRDCASCHGAAQAPKFADTDLLTAFKAALPKADFDAIPQSALVTKSMNGHCGQEVCRTDGILMTEAIAAWKDMQAAPGDGAGADIQVQWSAASQAVDENMAKITLEITNGFSPNPIKVDFQVSGTAAKGSDYDLSIPTTVTIPAFQTTTTLEIPLLDDLTFEGDESISLTLLNPVGAKLGSRSVQLVTLMEDDPAPTAQWSVAAQSVGEGSASPVLSVQLSNPSQGAVTIPVTLAGTAASPSDYTVVSGTVTIFPGTTSGTFPITLINDALDEDDETLVATLGTPSGAILGATKVHTLTVTDNDTPPVAQFSAAAQTVTEAASNQSFTVNLSAASGKAVTVPYTLGGTATAGSDYTLSNGQIVIPAGQTSGTVAFPLLDDSVFEGSETLVLTLGAPTNATLGAVATRTITIQDNESAPTVAFSLASQNVQENAGTATVTVQLNRASTSVVSVPYSVGGTSSGSDHNAANGTVTIAANQLSANIVFNVTDDSRDENNETLVLTLGSPSNATLGSVTIHTATLVDNDPAPTVAWASASQTVAENAGSVQVSVSVSAASEKQISIPFTVGGSATNPADHTLAAGSITIAALATSATVTVPIVSDGAPEADETIVLTLGSPTNAVLGANAAHTMTVTEGNIAKIAQFSVAAQSVAESAGTVALAVQLNGQTQTNIQVPYTVSGTATNPADHTLASGTLVISAGQSGASISLPIANDTMDEADETVIVALGTPTGASLGAISTQTVTITDNDNPSVVAFAQASRSVNEDAGNVTVSVALDRASGFPVTVPYSVAGTAANPADHSLANGSISIAAGQTSGTVTFAVANDTIDEADETVVVALGTPTNATLGTIAAQTITITDDDNASVIAFAQATRSVTESSGTTAIQVQLDRASSLAVSVPFTVAGTASNPADHGLAAGTISIPAGQTTGSVNMTVANDTLDEDDETVVITLGAPTNAALGSIAAQTVTITDNDAAPTIAWSSASQTVMENAGNVVLTASLSAASGRAISATVALGGTATVTADYAASPTTVSIPAGSTSATVTIGVVNDTLNENNETVTATLGGLVNASAGTVPTHTLTINDNDAAPSVAWELATTSINENAGNASIKLKLSAASGKTITVPFTFGGTATANVDYTAAASPVTINAGATQLTVVVPILDNSVAEPSDETVVLALGSPTGAALGSQANHAVTILDNDPASKAAVEAFRNTVYVITRRDCASCHGVSTAPLHAVSVIENPSNYNDLNTAYGAARSKVNFGSPAQSVMVARTKNGHCGAACSTNGAEMTNAIATWAQAENVNPNPVGQRFQFPCDPANKPVSAIQRLSNRELANTVSALLNEVGATLFADTQLQGYFTQLPGDIVSGKENTQVLNSNSVSLHLDIAYRVGQLVSGTSATLAAIPGTNGCLAANPVTQACVTNFINAFGRRALRRPVASAELTSFSTLYANASATTVAEKVTLVVAAMLQHPDFMYQVYDRGTPIGPNAYAMDAHSYASKLSYSVTGSPPDAALRALADDGTILTASVAAAQIDRLLVAKGGQDTVTRFYKEWLHYQNFDGFEYPASFLNGQSLNGLKNAMVSEVDNYVVDNILAKGTYKDLLTSTSTRFSSSTLAQVYGISNPNGAKVNLPAAQRAGLLTRAAFLSKRSGPETSPITRGKEMLTNFLCDAVGAPPVDAPAVIEPLPPGTFYTVRQRVANRTEQPGTSCVQCHSRLNPLGFVFEKYDSLGRFRTNEMIYASGTYTGVDLPVNSVATTAETETSPVTLADGVELSSSLSNNDKAMSCFAQRWNEFQVRRPAAATDYCRMNDSLNVLYGSDAAQGSIYDMIKNSILSPEFKEWRF